MRDADIDGLRHVTVPRLPVKAEMAIRKSRKLKATHQSYSEIGGSPFSKGPQTLRCILHI